MVNLYLLLVIKKVNFLWIPMNTDRTNISRDYQWPPLQKELCFKEKALMQVN